MDVEEMKWGDVDYCHVAQDRVWWWTLVKTTMNLRVS